MKGKELKIWLIEHDMTRVQLADELGVTLQTVSLWCVKGTPNWLSLALKGITQGDQS
jgi:DNA-binding XRE family transcriptional regulator